MTVEIVTSWYTLFQYAHAEGQARKAHAANPSSETETALNEAIAIHEDYRQMCLRADRMIHFPTPRR